MVCVNCQKTFSPKKEVDFNCSSCNTKQIAKTIGGLLVLGSFAYCVFQLFI